MDNKKWDEFAECYHDYVISPFQKNVENPMLNELDKLSEKKKLIVAEFGCGRFELGNFLSENFKKIFAFDFSEKMIEFAKKNNNFENVDLGVLDTTKMNFYEKFDVVISVNSIIMPSFKDIGKSFENIYNSLKIDGKFFLIVPSMESVLYDGMLVLERELGKKKEDISIKETKKIMEYDKYDYLLGHYTDEDGTQKFFYSHEVLYFLEKSGFKNIKIGKVNYPWGKKISDYEDFPKERPLWDWFVMCER